MEVFEGPIADNVAVGRARVSPDHVRRALAALRLTDGVADLPGGVHSVLSPTGSPLSNTQARVLVSPAPSPPSRGSSWWTAPSTPSTATPCAR